jgi:hypothetical protein
MTYDTFITEIQNLIHIILEQNYFQFNDLFYKQTNGSAMGAPTSALFSEIYLQYIEHNKICNLLQENHRDTTGMWMTY